MPRWAPLALGCWPLARRRSAPSRARTRLAARLAAPNPGRRAYDLTDPTTALHQRYHDGTIQYTMDNFEWVDKKGYSLSSEVTERERKEARARLFRWPRLEVQDTRRVEHGGEQPQQFCRGLSAEAAAALGDPGENVFVISLRRRPEKLRHALQQLEETRIGATIVTACDGDAILCQADLPALGVAIMPNYHGHVNHNMPFTTGEVGCFLSHYTIWHRMLEEQIPAALILEDDFDFQEDFAKRLGQYLLEAEGEDWNIMYVGRSPMENDVRRVSEHVVEPGYTLWTVGYILRLEGARALIESNAEQHMVPLDDFFSVAMGCGMDMQYNELAPLWSAEIRPILRGLATNPPLVMPYVGSMFLSDTAMLRKRTRYVIDLPATAPSGETPAAGPAATGGGGGGGAEAVWAEALHWLEETLAGRAAPPPPRATRPTPPPPPGKPSPLRLTPWATPIQEMQLRQLQSQHPPPREGEPPELALSRRYHLVGSWDDWVGALELERCGPEDPWFEAEIVLPKGEPIQFQLLCDASWASRCFPSPDGRSVSGPSSGGHGQNWRIAAPTEPSVLNVRWNPTGARALVFKLRPLLPR